MYLVGYLMGVMVVGVFVSCFFEKVVMVNFIEGIGCVIINSNEVSS